MQIAKNTEITTNESITLMKLLISSVQMNAKIFEHSKTNNTALFFITLLHASANISSCVPNIPIELIPCRCDTKTPSSFSFNPFIVVHLHLLVRSRATIMDVNSFKF